MKNGFQIKDPSNRLVRESNFIVTRKTPEMSHVSYTKNGVKYTVFRVTYTLAKLALTDYYTMIVFSLSSSEQTFNIPLKWSFFKHFRNFLA